MPAYSLCNSNFSHFYCCINKHILFFFVCFFLVLYVLWEKKNSLHLNHKTILWDIMERKCVVYTVYLSGLLELSALTVIDDSVTRRSSDLALLKFAKVELDTSGTERSFPASSDISYKYKIRIKSYMFF